VQRDPGVRFASYNPLFRKIHDDPRWKEFLAKLTVAGGARLPEARPHEAAALPSIAVLPFADMSPKHDQEYFADGVAEEIRGALSHIEGLKVIGRTSSFAFKGKSDDLKSIGQKLGVENVLEGSLRKDGNGIRITAQLIRVADGTHLWSESYDRKLSGVFKIQDDIAKSVVGALKVKLMAGAGAPAAVVQTASPEAYSEYLLGKRLLTQFAEESDRRAVEKFERAVRLDPGYAPAWAGLSAALGADSENNGTVETILATKRRALDAANRAIVLAPGLAEGYGARANLVDIRGWDWSGALADAARAVQLSPRDAAARTTYGMLLAEVGREREGIQELERATEIDPLSAEAWGKLAWFASGDRKRQAFDRSREIAPGNYFSSIPGGPVSREQALAITRGRPERDPIGRLSLIEAYRVLGQQAEARKALDELVACCAHNAAWQIALAHDSLGDRDRAFEWLDRARVQLDSGIRVLKRAQRFQGDRRTAAILKKMNLPVD
jgi:TolB-like protein/Flp pilus assembly protein TadD